MIEYCSPSDPSISYTTEGCFCPDGMKLFNKESDICVAKCGEFSLSCYWADYIISGHSSIRLMIMLIFQQDVLILREFLARWVKFCTQTCVVYLLQLSH